VKKLEDFNAEDRINLKLLEDHVHILYGDITEENINNAIKWLIYENLDTKTEKLLTLYINSQGGDLYASLGLIDMMRNSHHPIRTIGLGSVMSAGFLIFVSGSSGERYVARNTGIMSHQYSESMIGKHHDLKSSMREGDNLNKRMLEIIRAATGLTTAKIRSKLLSESDSYITAEESIELGVADHIL
jgi:ATP-dependent Clp protease, protease subunit